LRSLSTGAAAVVLGVNRKVLDNILTKEANYLLSSSGRGRDRRIGFPALQHIAVAMVLVRDLGVSVNHSLRLAEQILRHSDDGTIALGSLTTVHFDLVQLNRTLEAAVADTLEEFVAPRRGRPPRVRSEVGG
jgi:hypothetical protein